MFGITCGYEIRNGKLGRAIRDTTVSGIAFDMLKTVTVGSAAALEPNGSGPGRIGGWPDGTTARDLGMIDHILEGKLELK